MMAAMLLAAGCTASQQVRGDGAYLESGNAMHANTVLQMVDPWPAGVEETDLRVPADHKQYLPEDREVSGSDPAATNVQTTD